MSTSTHVTRLSDKVRYLLLGVVIGSASIFVYQGYVEDHEKAFQQNTGKADSGSLISQVDEAVVLEAPESLTSKNNQGSAPKDAPSLTATTSSDSDTDATTEVTQLEEEVKRLTAEVDYLAGQLAMMVDIVRGQKKAKATAEKIKEADAIAAEQTAGQDWSKQQVDAVYDEPFASYINKTSGPLKEDLHALNSEPVDEEWASLMETRINDFFVTHPNAHQVDLQLVECRTYRCQIGVVVVDAEGKPWKRIFDAMTLEPWFNFMKHVSAPIHDDQYKIIGSLFLIEGLPAVDV